MKLECQCGFKETDEEKFRDTEVGCEDCGSHSAIECPKCGKCYDHVWGDAVCEECGLLMDSAYGPCDLHPDANIISWWKDLKRGG